MLTLFEHVGFELKRARGRRRRVEFELAPTERYALSVEERDHIGVRASLRPFFEPVSVAVVGASSRRGTIGGELFHNILEGDFRGVVYPVNRKGEPVAGVRGYSSIGEIGDSVDLAVISVPGEHVYAAAEDALRSGVRCARRHLGRVRRVRQREDRTAGSTARARPFARCPAHRPQLSRDRRRRSCGSTPRSRPGAPHRQHRVLVPVRRPRTCAPRGDGVPRTRFPRRSKIGNKADVSSNDLLEWWEDDEDTDLVLLYVEILRQPAAVRSSGPARRPAQTHSRAQERDDRTWPARRELAYRSARRLGGAPSTRSSTRQASFARARSKS